MKAAEYFGPLVKLGRRVRDKGRDHGFALHTFAPTPTLEGDGPHHAHMAFLVIDELMDERGKADAENAQLAQALTSSPPTDDHRADEARKRLTNLEQRLRNPKKGILDD